MTTRAISDYFAHDVADSRRFIAGPQKVSGLMIPAYFYPNNPYTDTAFQAFLATLRTYRGVPVIVIMNPESGPGSVVDGNYTVAIKMVQATGALVAGYVSTSYTVRTLAAVKADIDKWKSFYSVEGIFLDEQTNDAVQGHVDYYAALTDYCHTAGYYPVISNPGSNQISQYFAVNTGDIIVVHENTSFPVTSDMLGNFSGGHIEYPADRRAVLVYNQSTLSTSAVKTCFNYVGWVYVTSGSGGSPWSTIPTYLGALFGVCDTRPYA